MKKSKGNKKVICSLSLILMLATTFLMVFTQSSLAQVGIPQPEKTVGYISVAPTLIGVGQTATVNLWIFPLPDNYYYQASYLGFNGITVTFIKPNGSEDTFMPVDATGIYDPGQTQALGALYFYYEPDMVGEWSVSFTMPAQEITDSTGTVQYMACTSNSFSFTVTEEEQLAGLLNGYPWAELPNEDSYWSYPINSNNREWNQISGDWLGSSLTGLTVTGATSRLWQPYGSGPSTAHIVWKQPYKAGGLIGGDYGSLSYSSAITVVSATIMGGKLFMNIPNEYNFGCIDLATGEILYTAPGQITNGIHLPGNPYAQSLLATPGQTTVYLQSYGNSPTSYLFSSGGALLSPGNTWNYYDPFTGTLMMSIANASTASYYLIDGTNLAYGTTLDGQLFAWDLEKVIEHNIFTEFYSVPGTALIGDWPAGLVWTRPLPTPLATAVGLTSSTPTIFATSTDASTIVLRTNPNQYWGYSAEDGTQLWNLNLTYPALINEQISLYGVNDFIVFDPTETTFHCYSMLTGAELWESPSFADSPWATTWTVYGSETNDYDNFYTMFPDGTMAAMSLATGKLDWRNTAIPSTEYTANAVPYVTPMLMVGGNIYAYAGSSNLYQQNPIPRFAMLTCVDATSGDTTWTLNGGVMPIAAANGYVTGYGMSDGNIYCIGKGSTKTTVEAPMDAIPKGTDVTIRGTVIDMSPASQDDASQVRFPNGVPAVADEDMSEWMDYLHMQNATLLNASPTPKGVPVKLTAIGSDDSVIDIGTTTTNGYYGTFAHPWTPPDEDTYEILATFEGSESYWSSGAATAVTVGPAPTTDVGPGEEPAHPIISTEAAIIIGVVIIAFIAIIAYLVMRKPNI